MPIVTPNWNLPTPALTDAYNLVGDLATFSSAVDSAITSVANARKGTAAQRIAAAASSPDGVLWQDTDGIKMIWRRDGSVGGSWAPAVSRWIGTAAQMNAFTQAPGGFEWFNTSDSKQYLRSGLGWVISGGARYEATLTPVTSGGGNTGGWYFASDSSITFPVGLFTSPPKVWLYPTGSGFQMATATTITATGMTYIVSRLGQAPTTNTRVNIIAIQ